METAFGQAIGSGDINGDGQNDLIIGDPNVGYQDWHGGRFYVYYGGTILDSILDDSVNVFHPIDNDFITGTVLGDVNGDGLVDLGYFGQTPTSGYVAILMGAVPMDSVPDYIIWSPTETQSFGATLVSLGDLNKDGYVDFAAGGGDGPPSVFFGGNPFAPTPRVLQEHGDRIANIGDINHDGWDDVGVGLPAYGLGVGIAFVYFGYRDLDTVPDLVINPPIYVGSEFGYSIGPAGDFDGDGIDDVVISGMEWYGGGSSDRGAVCVYAGSDTLPTTADEIEDAQQLPDAFGMLRQNYPNPFNEGTTISYELRGFRRRLLSLSIYNIAGQSVRTLSYGWQSSGEHEVYWDGRDDSGCALSSGIYVYVLKSGEMRLSRKMVYLK